MSNFCFDIYFCVVFSFGFRERRTRGAEEPRAKAGDVKAMCWLRPFSPSLFGRGDLDVSALAHSEQPGEWVLAPAGASQHPLTAVWHRGDPAEMCSQPGAEILLETRAINPARTCWPTQPRALGVLGTEISVFCSQTGLGLSWLLQGVVLGSAALQVWHCPGCACCPGLGWGPGAQQELCL